MPGLPTPTLPIPIPRVGDRYLLFDIDHVAYLRRQHNVPGVLVGSIPQQPQQNIFHGLPVQLMPEEARVLVETGVAYVFDDVAAHAGLAAGRGLAEAERRAFARALRRQGVKAGEVARDVAQERKRHGLKREMKKDKTPRKADGDNLRDGGAVLADAGERDGTRNANGEVRTEQPEESDTALFARASPPPSSRYSASAESEVRFFVTPTTSTPPLHPPAPPESPPLPSVPVSYPLFKHLHDRGYFMFPGLRFGCQYSVYPGDPLRYHSHFLAMGMAWEDEFDLLDLVGGGRLGTGVKKGYLIGGKKEPEDTGSEGETGDDDGVRTFCIEWAGM